MTTVKNDLDADLVKVGSPVHFRNSNGNVRNALVTQVGETDPPYVSLVYVTSSGITMHEASVPHESLMRVSDRHFFSWFI